MDSQLVSLSKLGQSLKSLKDLKEQPKQLSKLIALLKDLDAEEIGLITECLSNLSSFKKQKRMALWKSLKIFLDS
ncbi:MAG: hypothetical protein HRU09_20545 [Oligoflexales bacterium]|nr:hypothetical protein [Oligoflexales bacterium]